MGHDAAACSEFVGEGDEGEVLAHEEADVHGEAPKCGCDGAEGGCDGALGLAATHLGSDDVVVERGETE